jgi:tartrate dehydratase alpha subunit/fumarate hydratase class I-like protein
VIGGDSRQTASLAQAIQRAAEKEVRKAVNKGIRSAVEPAKAAASASALAILPRRGGLAARVARAKWRVQILQGSNPGVVLAAKLAKEHGGGSVALSALDKGTLWHSVYGRRTKWVLQHVRPGWVSTPLERMKPEIAQGVEAAVREVIAGLSAGSGS